LVFFKLPDAGENTARDVGLVMPGLVPGIHVFRAATKSWLAGTSPAMTTWMGHA
jgi:hypothetical protein